MPNDDPRGVLHRHEDGTTHRHFREGFGIGGQVIADDDGTGEHRHGTMSMTGEGSNFTSGPVVLLFINEHWIEPHDCQDHYGAVATGDPCIICHPEGDA